MALPLKYNGRSLWVRSISTIMTILCIAGVTIILIWMIAMGTGLEKTLVGTGHPLNLIVLRPRQTETTSMIDRSQAADIAALEGIQKDTKGDPLASFELVAVAGHLMVNGKKSNLALRGIGPKSLELRDGLKLTDGRWPNPGLGELAAGKGAQGRFTNLKVGDRPFIRGRQWSVVGSFEAGGQAYESEVWGDIDDLKTQFKREYSTVIVRARDAASMDRIARLIGDDKRLQLEAKPHAEYYKSQNQSAEMMKGLGGMVGFVMAIGALFGAANMMYAAVASRKREIATLRVLGFGRLAIGFSFVLESAFVGLCGGILGAIVARIFIDGITSGTANWVTFTDLAFHFRVTPGLMAQGIFTAVFVGAVGGLLPAWRASRTTIAHALRGM
ncbi:MAG TPA: FtsX-like permease family protein [Planctomycetota bacterium]|nr:FtsX-like permease family protein [Planctomycetota bacterium]